MKLQFLPLSIQLILQQRCPAIFSLLKTSSKVSMFPYPVLNIKEYYRQWLAPKLRCFIMQGYLSVCFQLPTILLVFRLLRQKLCFGNSLLRELRVFPVCTWRRLMSLTNMPSQSVPFCQSAPTEQVSLSHWLYFHADSLRSLIKTLTTNDREIHSRTLFKK